MMASFASSCRICNRSRAISRPTASSITVYESPAGPITAHDMMFGFSRDLASGYPRMAHNCGFTAGVLLQEVDVRPTSARSSCDAAQSLEVAAVAGSAPRRSMRRGRRLLDALQCCERR
jgi:hypothetical protein